MKTVIKNAYSSATFTNINTGLADIIKEYEGIEQTQQITAQLLSITAAQLAIQEYERLYKEKQNPDIKLKIEECALALYGSFYHDYVQQFDIKLD